MNSMSSFCIPMIFYNFEYYIHDTKKQFSNRMSINTFTSEKIDQQRKLVFSENPILKIVAPCKIGEGILKISPSDRVKYADLFEKSNKKVCLFIPASGSGSRMFEFLYDFLEAPNDSNRAQVERFLNKVQSFAFFRQLPKEKQDSILNFNLPLDEIVTFLLKKEGMGYGELPKGLIPFHVVEPFVLNPFQEQIIQGSKLKSRETSFHFTIQAHFQQQISQVVNQLQGLTGNKFDVSYSEQNKETDSFAFEEDGKVLIIGDKPLRRPAGHGALLDNLQQIKEELVFVKNIDNVQHYSKSETSNELWNALAGLILSFKAEMLEISKNPSIERLKETNHTFDAFSDSELATIKNTADLLKFVNRPIRICGMVRNEGQPGGGPFLVEENGVITKQIVEKAQISSSPDQYNQMVKSTHFNPVMMVLSYQNSQGENYNLNEFSDDSKYFIVQKKQHGKNIRFMELPGLWNGAMANWITIFVEIPNETFSPVKTVLDLLNTAHLPTE